MSDTPEFIDPETHPALARELEAQQKDPLWIACQQKRWTDCVAQAAAGDAQAEAFYFHNVHDAGTDGFLNLTRADFLADVDSIRRSEPSPRMCGQWPDSIFTTKPNEN